MTTLLYYPLQYTLPEDLFLLTTRIRGFAFPPGTRSLLFIGRDGDPASYCYGPGTDDPTLAGTPSGNGVDPWCYDPCDSSKGTHSYPYYFRV